MKSPFDIIKDLERMGFLSPFFIKAYSITSEPQSDDWVITLIGNKSMYISNTELGYVELSIPILSIPLEERSTINFVSNNLLPVHSICNGFTSVEESNGKMVFLYHLPLVSNYTDEILIKFLKNLNEDASYIKELIDSISDDDDLDDDSMDLDLLEDQLDSLEDDEDQD